MFCEQSGEGLARTIERLCSCRWRKFDIKMRTAFQRLFSGTRGGHYLAVKGNKRPLSMRAPKLQIYWVHFLSKQKQILLCSESAGDLNKIMSLWSNLFFFASTCGDSQLLWSEHIKELHTRRCTRAAQSSLIWLANSQQSAAPLYLFATQVSLFNQFDRTTARSNQATHRSLSLHLFHCCKWTSNRINPLFATTPIHLSGGTRKNNPLGTEERTHSVCMYVVLRQMRERDCSVCAHVPFIHFGFSNDLSSLQNGDMMGH